jgi:hypothetical protein
VATALIVSDEVAFTGAEYLVEAAGGVVQLVV